jgi:hypothetical protein
MPDPATARQPTSPHVYDGWNSLGHPRNSPCQPVPVFDRERLLELAVAAGLDRDKAGAVLEDPTAYADEVRQDEREAHELGATGVPFFVLDRRYGVSGGQPAEVFRQALEEAWRTRPQAPKLVSVPGLDPDEIAQSGEVCGPDGTCAVPQR